MQKHAMDRRAFLKTSAAAFVAAQAGVLGLVGAARADAYSPPPLPYPENALEPVISARTVSYHYGKHTLGYYRKINARVGGSELEGKSLEQVIRLSADRPDMRGVFNNAAQAWNHTFYWDGIRPGGNTPNSRIMDAITASFGSFELFRRTFVRAGADQFASGWAWLVDDGDRLLVVRTPDAVNPMVRGMRPLLTMDVWEHAYYLDYQNRRGDYIEGFFDQLVNWDVVASRL